MKYSFLLFCCFFFLIISCEENKTTSDTQTTTSTSLIKVPPFNADSSYHYIEKQISFGPRVPNSDAHAKCATWLIKNLKNHADTVYVQAAQAKAYDGTVLNFKNIIAAFNPLNKNRIILAAHWDTRPYSDQDKDQSQWRNPIDGANDGASGVAVLLEIARQLKVQKIEIGIDIILFDAEDYGQPSFSKLPQSNDSYCLGSQYWSNNKHIQNYSAQYGILLDMVGAKGSTFLLEDFSMQVNPDLMRKVWNKAHQLGHTQYFLFQKTAAITDDHFYVSTIGKIPMIDVISLHPQNIYSFHESWHTQNDNISIIDKNVLLAVGETVLHTIYEEAAKAP
jgi:hypothetical protein